MKLCCTFCYVHVHNKIQKPAEFSSEDSILTQLPNRVKEKNTVSFNMVFLLSFGLWLIFYCLVVVHSTRLVEECVRYCKYENLLHYLVPKKEK